MNDRGSACPHQAGREAPGDSAESQGGKLHWFRGCTGLTAAPGQPSCVATSRSPQGNDTVTQSRMNVPASSQTALVFWLLKYTSVLSEVPFSWNPPTGMGGSQTKVLPTQALSEDAAKELGSLSPLEHQRVCFHMNVVAAPESHLERTLLCTPPASYAGGPEHSQCCSTQTCGSTEGRHPLPFMAG